DSHLFGNREGVLAASADGRAFPVVADNPQARKRSQRPLSRFETLRMPEVVLRDGLRVLRDTLHCRPARYTEDPGKVALNHFRQLLWREGGGGRIACAADEAGHKNLACWGAVGKQGRVPHRPQGAQSGGAWREESKPREPVSNLLAPVTQ